MNTREKAEHLMDLLETDGYEAYEVGGCVRDMIMNRRCSDIDITTSAFPDETERILEKNNIQFFETGLKHGTVTAVLDGENFEITTYRVDGAYSDSRHPESVLFVRNIEEDLSRRDFTVNAVAYNPKKGFVDLFGGRADIENKRIRAVGDPDKRFCEDALRIMRAIRFSSVLGFNIEEETKKALFKNKELLLHISAERIFTELSKLLLGDNVYTVLVEYREILAVVIPEISACFDFPQRTKWHLYDVWRHTCKTVEASPKDLGLRLTMLLHDIGKPYSRTTDDRGVDHFKGHQAVSADLARNVLKRLKISKALYDRVMCLIPIHDMHIGIHRKNVKRWLFELGEERLLDLVYVKRADKMGQNPEMTGQELANLEITEELIHSIIEEGEAFTVKDLAVNGFDLMSLGFTGKEIGCRLDDILTKVISEEIENNRDAILTYLENKQKRN